MKVGKSNKRLIIGLVGEKNHGKTESAKMIQALLLGVDDYDTYSKMQLLLASNYNIVNFADELKSMVSVILGCSIDKLEERDFKENFAFNPRTKELLRVDDMFHVGFVYTDADKYDEAITFNGSANFEHYVLVRTMLQYIGTNVMRNKVDRNYWIKILQLHMLRNYDSSFIVGDIRFQNETDCVTELGGITIKIVRSNVTNNNISHQSESEVKSIKTDFVVENDGTLIDLFNKLKQTLREADVLLQSRG